jgi:hypothetical protein
MGPYMALIVPSSFYGIDAGLHALSFSLTSLWRHERFLFSVFRGILPAIFGRFSKKLSTSALVHQVLFMALTPDCLHWVFLLVSMYTNKYNNLQKHKLFTDEFHYLKWIMKCTEIVHTFLYIHNGLIYLHSLPPTPNWAVVLSIEG